VKLYLDPEYHSVSLANKWSMKLIPFYELLIMEFLKEVQDYSSSIITKNSKIKQLEESNASLRNVINEYEKLCVLLKGNQNETIEITIN